MVFYLNFSFEPILLLMLKKQSILQIKNVYTANAFQTQNGTFVGAGSETEPRVFLYNLQQGKAEEVPDCPGGMMSFLPVPGEADYFTSIMGLFPPFIGGDAGLYVHHRGSQGWRTEKAISLPFAHRCEFMSLGGMNYLLAATVSKLKENPADWSRSGEVHLISLNDPSSLPWESTVIDNRITRNHGMIKANLDGQDLLYVSGEQGVFSIGPGAAQLWEIKSIYHKEVSEVVFMDLDGDGFSEMITIEPFHGSTLNIYKKLHNQWELLFSDSLAFGHGLNCGVFNEEAVIVVGNRSDSLALELFRAENLKKGIVQRKLIEGAVGPTQTQVFRFEGTDYILSANQKKNEVALYSGSLE
jgi:hypothetical protein